MSSSGLIDSRLAAPARPTWGFTLAWIVLTTLAIPLSFFLTLLILKLIIAQFGDYIVVNGVRHITEDYLALYFWLPLLALGGGAAQAYLLRRHLPHPARWVWATLGGWLLGALLPFLITWLGYWNNSSPLLDGMLLWFGLTIGAAQWLVLRRWPQAGVWIAASVLGWGLLALITDKGLDMIWLFLVGLPPALTTGLALNWLLRPAPAAASARPA